MSPAMKLAIGAGMMVVALMVIIAGVRLVFQSKPTRKLLGRLRTDVTGVILPASGTNQNITLTPMRRFPREGILIWDKNDPRVKPAEGIRFGTETIFRKEDAQKLL